MTEQRIIADVIADWRARRPDWFADCTIDLDYGNFDAWAPLLDHAFSEIEDIVRRDLLLVLQITQIKEKFGSLRVYVRRPSNLWTGHEVEAVLERLRVSTPPSDERPL